MAGIGFELNKLARRDDLLGVAGAYIHSAFAIAGPWLFTVVALAFTTYFYGGSADMEFMNFRGVIVYNFSFSLALSAPVYMIMTRYLADQIHVRNVTTTPTVMLESMILVFAFNLPVALFFYVYYFDMDLSLRLAGFSNMFLIAGVWLLSVYLTALKDFSAVTRAYLIGMAVAVLCARFLCEQTAAGLVAGYNVGLAVIVFLLAGRIFAEYPYKLTTEFALKPFWSKYWELAVGGFFYNMALWIDKWIMWYAPEATELPTRMRFYPDYDSAMFMAAMTILPSLALFVFSVETAFFNHYRKFYGNILAHASMRRILSFHSKITESILEGGRNTMLLQGSIALLVILLAPQIFDAIGMFFMQLAIFRLGVLGSFFQVLLLFATIILAYFDCRRNNMWVFIFYFVSNTLLTLVFMQMGYEYYGYGFFLASALTFMLAATLLFSHVRKLPYHAFITNNNSVKLPKLRTGADEEYGVVRGEFAMGVDRQHVKETKE
ncbi:MAG: exopolysaccharide Pel transporter PelG [Alphaproteobacteria bacterium]|nr:exopolysaccharide Pel transporter PelG [Alphaproteobacteria bacterium]